MIDHSTKAQVIETEQVEVEDADGAIRCFELSSGDGAVKVRLCSLGASITNFFVKNPTGTSNEYDDIVLGYDSVASMRASKNPCYFGAIVGRVANRIKNARFDLNGRTYDLEANNPPNHLHGGSGGFSHRIWNVERTGVIDNYSHAIPFVCFSLDSLDGDQGYPASVRVTALYSLRPALFAGGSTLCVDIKAELLQGSSLSTPINLAQHSYFNLAPFPDRANGILDHALLLESDAYTPIDSFSIPTRQVRSLQQDPSMSFASKPRQMKAAIQDYGVSVLNYPAEQVQSDLGHRMPDTPYGIDHNYVVRQQPFAAIPKVATLSYNTTTLEVHSTAPGVQVYTGNYLGEGDEHAPWNHKELYKRWSGVCLETQHFPDSIAKSSSDLGSSEFAKGRCPILSSQQREYRHTVEYTVYHANDTTNVGSDTEGRYFDSVESMWLEQSLSTWYRRSKAYYEDNCPSTVDGVLGNLGWLSKDDIEGSRKFLDQLGIDSVLQDGLACECGAGIGRVTKGLLLDVCKRCDVVESSSRLLSAAPDYIGRESHRCRFFCSELQDWLPQASKYGEFLCIQGKIPISYFS